MARLQTALRERRLAKGITQEALGEAVGVTRQTIIAIEKQKFAPSVRLALGLARVFRVPLEDLFWLTNANGKAL